MKIVIAKPKAIRRSYLWFTLVIVALFFGCTQQTAPPVDVGTPKALYRQLFYDVQNNPGIFSDSKTFVDCVPKEEPASIRKAYQNLAKRNETTVLKQFVQQYFIIPAYKPVVTSDTLPIRQHIRHLWQVLLRQPDKPHSGTLIPLPKPYIVPGGRFREIYYWDSYFTMLGLAADNRYDIIRDMIDNFVYLTNTLGFIPNGNRTYYMTRSQPPFFSLMVSLLANAKGDSIYTHYLPDMLAEYKFWMDGAEKLSPQEPALEHVVRMDDGTILNRYCDKSNTPRPESYREDVRTVNEAFKNNPSLDKSKMYRDIRSAAESGWDFSSRWLTRASNGSFPLSTIHTTDIVPVDLNALMYNMEETIAYAARLKGDTVLSGKFKAKAQLRLKAIQKYCWNQAAGYYFDFDYIKGTQTGIISAAGIFPLYFHMPSDKQASRVKKVVGEKLLSVGGITATPYVTGQQWDAPNGWAPLQWIAIQGLRNYGFNELAGEIKHRWMKINEVVYANYHRMEEKYNVINPDVPGGGGEYPNQDGFGWTNGVYQALASEQ